MKAAMSADIPAQAFGEAIPVHNQDVTVHIANIVSVEGYQIILPRL